VTDTVFWERGTIQQVDHFSAVKSIDLSPAEMFQRGIRPGDPITEVRMTDSIRFYDETGTYLEIRVTSPKTGRYGLPKGQYRRSSVTPKKEELLKHTTEVDYLEARAGMLIKRRVWLPAGKEFYEVRRLDEYPGIEILQTPADTSGSFTTKIRIPAGAATPKLRLDIGEKSDWEKSFSLHSYHLNETDFKLHDELTDEQTWRAGGRDRLYLRLRSTEKLMHIYRDGEQYKVLPVGRQLDEVRVGSLPAGKYLLEIIDLRSREKRYHWITTGK
jgi:hypothetical protein